MDCCSNKKRKYRRYIITSSSEKTDLLTLVLDVKRDEIILITGYPGEQCPPMPGLGASLRECRWWYDPDIKTGHALRAKDGEGIRVDLIYRPKPGEPEIPWVYPDE